MIRPIQKFYLKVIFISGLGFASLLLLVDIFMGAENLFLKFFWNFLFFGLVMYLITARTLVKKIQEIKKSSDLNEKDLLLHQTAVIKTDLDEHTIMNKLKNDELYGAMKLSKNGDSYVLRSKMKWNLFGERIKIQFKESNSILNVYFDSQPVVPINLLDQGRSYYNLYHFKNNILANNS